MCYSSCVTRPCSTTCTYYRKEVSVYSTNGWQTYASKTVTDQVTTSASYNTYRGFDWWYSDTGDSDLVTSKMAYKQLDNKGDKIKIVLHEEMSSFSISNNSSKGTESRISGHVEVFLNTPHSDIQDVKLRFVGGVVARSKAKGQETDEAKQVFIGSERLFDKSVLLLSNQSCLDKGIHTFPFQLSLPHLLPPSFKTRLVMVEYLLVAVVGFQNGCCGMIPILQKDPLMSRTDIQVTVSDLHASYPRQIERTLRELNDPDNDDNHIEMGLIDDCLCIFSLDHSNFMLQINPIQTIYHNFNFSIQKDIDTLINMISYSVWEKCSYKYHVEYHNHKAGYYQDVQETCLASGNIDLIDGEYLDATDNENNVLLTIPVLESPLWIENVNQDLYTKPATITHYIRLSILLEKGAELLEYNLKLPIQFAESTSEPHQFETSESTEVLASVEQYSLETVQGLRVRRRSR